ncbi:MULTISPECIES: helix-turn-helix domain-containing protein [Streptomyces]|uniref:Helix-turn-helix domain-containing protein n=2 Tax=Streptomyces TaxID=1883 RepID=A0ABV9IUC7_9ACTN
MAVHGTEVRQKALTLLHGGVRNADVARRLNIPAGTIGKWLHEDRAKRGACPGKQPPKCPRCDGRPLDDAAYAYLLGLYLGDGWISEHRRGVHFLRIACADAWPGLIDACEAAIRAVHPDNSVCRVQNVGYVAVTSSSKHWPCLFPQHGPGKKHERQIALEPWQQDIVDTHPWDFIRGLIHSDGCRLTNWTTRLVAGKPKRYEYPRYFFTNVSSDIIRLFTKTLDSVGVEWKQANAKNISVAKKASVALLDAHVGPKH